MVRKLPQNTVLTLKLQCVWELWDRLGVKPGVRGVRGGDCESEDGGEGLAKPC